MKEISTRRGLLGLSPVIVFLLLYVVVSVIAGDFYAMPFAVARSEEHTSELQSR